MSGTGSDLADDPLAAVDWPVRTPRLVLRRATGAADLEATWAYWRLPEVRRWLGSSPEDPAAHRARQLAPARLGATVLVLLGDRVIGDLMIRVGDAWAQAEAAADAAGTQAELGWVFDPEVGGLGYATEAVRAAIDCCMGPLRLRRVVASCFAANEASWRLMERVGMRLEAHGVRDSLHAELGWLDGYEYALLAEEWPTRRGTAGHDAAPGTTGGPSTTGLPRRGDPT